MKNKNLHSKKALRAALSILLLSVVGMTKAMAQSFTVGDLNYSVNDDGTSVTLTGHFYGTTAIGTLSIPNEVSYNYQTYPVTAIGNSAFKNCTGLTGSVVIPNSVITIGDYAFQGCYTMHGSLTIGTSVTAIGIRAFEDCGFHTVNYNATACPSVPYDFGQYVVFEGCSFLETLNIGNNVQIIPDNMFRECPGFTGSLVLPNSLTTIGKNAFNGCSGFTGSLTIPEAVTSIGESAFIYCSGFTGDLTIGNSVSTIGKWAFNGCDGFSGALTIGTSVTEIGVGAFGYCYDLSAINLNATNWTVVGDYWNGGYQNPFYAYNNQIGPTNAILNIGENVQTIPERAFAGCNGLTGSLTIPNSVTTIGNSAFSNCSGFTGNLVIGNSVTSIGNSAFNYCSGFTGDLTIPNSVISIGEYAFLYCSGFTGTLTIPNSVTTIVNSAFWGCCNLETIMVEAGNTAYDSRDNCNALIKTSTNELLVGCKNTVIPNSVTTIGWNAFTDCSSMTGSLIIPNSVTSIGGYSFYGCSGLTSLTIGNSVTSIELSSFTDCIGLTSIQVLAETPPNTQGYGSFYNIDYSIPVTVPCGSLSAYQNTYKWNFFTNIQEYCDPLTYSINDDGVSVTVTGHVDGTAATGPLVIPETKTIDGVTYAVTKIGTSAFGDCTGLTGDLIIPNSVVTIGAGAFRNCTGFTGNLVIGNSVTTINFMAFYCQSGANYTGTLTIPNSVTYIGSSAFSNCSGLTGNLDIPSSVTSMSSPFSGCNGFTSVTLHWDMPNSSTIGITNYDIPITVPCGTWSLYQYSTSWYNYTNIQEDCSGMFVVSATANPTEGGSVIYRAEGETLFFDPFEEYTAGNTIAAEAIAAGHDWWTTWNNTPGSEKDGLVAEYDGTQCGHLTYGNDQVILFGDKESGVYDVEFDILVPDGKSAYFSLLHQFNNGSANEAIKFHLHVSDSYDLYTTPGQGFIKVGSSRLAYIPCVYDGWMHFRFNVDIDADVAQCYFTAPEGEELFLCQWQWSRSSQTNMSTLGGMDFWPPLEESSEFYIDNVRFSQFDGERSSGNNANVQIISENVSEERGAVRTSKYFAPGSTCTLTAIPNEGYTFVNWTRNGVQVSTGPVLSFIVKKNIAFVANFEANTIAQTTALTPGWNWYSTYIEQEGIDGLGQLENSIGIPKAIIQSQNDGYVKSIRSHGQTVWQGVLGAINNEEMYKIATKVACTATIEGQITDPSSHPITINKGWNWIGFPSNQSVSVGVAMSGFTPKNNDVIKGIHSYATFSNGTWSGTLNILEPGQGYMYGSRSNTPKTLVFQTGRGEATIANITPENNFFQPSADYADNMTLTAVVDLDGAELRSEDYELAAFVGDECRGSVKLMYVESIDRYVAFLTVFGDQEEDMRFVLTNGENMNWSDDPLAFAVDGMSGTLTEPATLRFGTSVQQDYVNIFPNPSNGVFNIEGKGIRRVNVVDAYGQVVLSKEVANDIMQIDLRGKAAGVYMLQVVTDNGITTRQLIKK